MPRLIINNSISYIINIPNPIKFGLREQLSYPDKSAQFAFKKATGRFKAFRKYLCDNAEDGLSFPTGLLPLVQEYLNSHSVVPCVEDQRKKPGKEKTIGLCKNSKLPPLRDYQEEIVGKCIDEHRGIVEAATGTGKTRIMIELIYGLRLPTLVIVPSINICKQTYRVLADALEERWVGIVGGGKKEWNKKIVVATFQSLINQDPKLFAPFQMVIIDEAHHAACDTIQAVNTKLLNHIYYRYYLTATPFRNDGADLALSAAISTKKISQYNFVEAHQDGHLVPPVFLFYPYEHKVESPYNQDDYLSEYNALISENLAYNQMVARAALRMREKKRQILIFVKQVKQGEILHDLIEGSVLLTGLETMTESEKILKDFEDKKFDILIGTSVIGEGIDMKSVDCGIMAGAGRARGDIMQKIGRGLRLSPGKINFLIVDFTHTNSNFQLRHARERWKIYASYNTRLYLMKHPV